MNVPVKMSVKVELDQSSDVYNTDLKRATCFDTFKLAV